MKKLSLLSLLFAICTSAAVAADKPGDHPQDDVGAGRVGTTQINLSVQLTETSTIIFDAGVTTLDDQPAQASISTNHVYIASASKGGDKERFTEGVVQSGFSMTLTPHLTKDDHIEVAFIASKAELTSINKFKQDDMEVDLPQVTTMELKQKVRLDNGKEVSIPFGHLIKSENGDALRSQYTLKLTATKG